MAHMISIDVIDITIPEGNHRNIPVINKPNQCFGYSADANEVRMLIQLSNYNVYEAGTSNLITGKNYYDYFPEEQPGGGGGVTPDQVQAMIENSIDASVSDTSTNSIQNKVIKQYVDDHGGSTYTAAAGGGLKLSGVDNNEFGHSNTAITAQTNADVYKVKHDTLGHIVESTAASSGSLVSGIVTAAPDAADPPNKVTSSSYDSVSERLSLRKVGYNTDTAYLKN